MVDSITKTRVTEEQAVDVVHAAFGADVGLVSLRECTEGWFNAVYELGLDDGRTFVLKVAPPAGVAVQRYERDIITSEVDALRLVAARTKAPVPAVRYWDPDGRVLPSPAFVMDRCPGTLLSVLRPTLTPANAARVDAQILGIVASINAITATSFGRPEPSAPREARWATAFTRIVDDLLADAVDAAVDLPVPAARFADLVRVNHAALDAVKVPRLIHWDLWDTNVFIDPERCDVVGVIDFERVLWADPLMEAQFLGKRADDDTTAPYGRPVFGDDAAAQRRRLYDMYLYLVMVVECSYRNYPDDGIEQFARPMLAAALEELGIQH